MATKVFRVGPQDGWVQLVTGADTAIDQLVITVAPHTHPVLIYGGTTAPAATVDGIRVCHHSFHLNVAGNKDLFFVKVPNPLAYAADPTTGVPDGRISIQVYTQGGVLS